MNAMVEEKCLLLSIIFMPYRVLQILNQLPVGCSALNDDIWGSYIFVHLKKNLKFIVFQNHLATFGF